MSSAPQCGFGTYLQKQCGELKPKRLEGQRV